MEQVLIRAKSLDGFHKPTRIRESYIYQENNTSRHPLRDRVDIVWSKDFLNRRSAVYGRAKTGGFI